MEIPKNIVKTIQTLSQIDDEQVQRFLSHFYEERHLYRTIINEMPFGVIVVDAQKGIVINNDVVLPFIKNKKKDPRGSELEFYDENLNNNLTEIFSTGTYDQTCRIEVHNPRFAYIHWNSIPIFSLSKGDDLDYLVLIIRDITEEVMRNRKLFQAEKLSFLGTLTAGIAHEIRNPLNNLFIRLSIMEELTGQIQEPLQKEMREEVEGLKTELERLSKLTSDFLKIARPFKIRRVPCNLYDLLKELLQSFRREFQQKNIQVELDVSNKEKNLYVDPKNIYQAMYNLIKNAIESIEEKGTISLKVWYGKEKCYIEVSDTGKGIYEKNLGKIFEPYFSTKRYGSGLGLMNVYNIIKAHDGEIQVDSTVDKGTTFQVKLPITKGGTKSLPWPGDQEYNT